VERADARGRRSRSMKLKSSSIAEVFHNPATRTLVVHFTDGTKYSYQSVTPQKFLALTQAQSAGQYLNENIRGKHKHQQLTEKKK
jgi:hypothetical protein